MAKGREGREAEAQKPVSVCITVLMMQGSMGILQPRRFWVQTGQKMSMCQPVGSGS